MKKILIGTGVTVALGFCFYLTQSQKTETHTEKYHQEFTRKEAEFDADFAGKTKKEAQADKAKYKERAKVAQEKLNAIDTEEKVQKEQDKKDLADSRAAIQQLEKDQKEQKK